MTRVMIIGNAGGGKSTLSGLIATTHALPCFSVDHIQWQPGWVATPEAEFDQTHGTILRTERWIIDGYGPWASVIERINACDTVIFVDLPFAIHLWWAAKRQVKSLFSPQNDEPDGCRRWKVTGRLFRMMWQLHRDLRPRLIDEIYQRAGQLRIIHLKSIKELNAFAHNPV